MKATWERIWNVALLLPIQSFVVVVMKIQVAVNKNTKLDDFCLYLVNVMDAVCHILDPDVDAQMKTHNMVRITMNYSCLSHT